jgi:hypothetical protein
MSPKANSRRYSGLASMTEQDDMENWNYASAASQGTMPTSPWQRTSWRASISEWR